MIMDDLNYIVAGTKPWNRKIFDEIITSYPGRWHFIKNPDDLEYNKILRLNPRFIFFFHWSAKVNEEIFNSYECVCFHMTDVPYGRGGSPLQNLIVRGHRQTKVTALRMVQDFDAGPVYLKEDLTLEGNAEEVYIRASYLSAKMVHYIISNEPTPEPQMGDPVIFKRRIPEESCIPELSSLQPLHDFIRMLDADGYPNAFFEYGEFRYKFSRAALYNGKIIADVEITQIREADK
jgi:methionyl-tRNA formyltransferase